MKKLTKKIILDVVLILMLVFVTGVMFKLAFTIRSDGGMCTAKPEIYLENKLEEQFGKPYNCKCMPVIKEYDYITPINWSWE